jgi:urease accessory protein UreH
MKGKFSQDPAAVTGDLYAVIITLGKGTLRPLSQAGCGRIQIFSARTVQAVLLKIYTNAGLQSAPKPAGGKLFHWGK